MIMFGHCVACTSLRKLSLGIQRSFPAFDHNDVIAKSSLNLHVFWVCRSTGLKVESRLLEC